MEYLYISQSGKDNQAILLFVDRNNLLTDTFLNNQTIKLIFV